MTDRRRRWVARVALPLVCLGLGLGGCSQGPSLNPSFRLTPEQARAELTRLNQTRTAEALARPVVVIGGLLDPLGIGVGDLAEGLGRLLPPSQKPLVVGLVGANTMEECRERVIAAVQAQYPSDDVSQTVEVDVVGFSLGGVVARDAAIRRTGERRLKIARLFTLASPHRGTPVADAPTLDDRIAAIRPASPFITRINAELGQIDYEIVPYVRLGDSIVDPVRAAPPGAAPWWVDNLPLQRAHGQINEDPRVLADIARRLRGLDPLSKPPPTPVPGSLSPSTASEPLSAAWE
jgi:hypothetical protein